MSSACSRTLTVWPPGTRAVAAQAMDRHGPAADAAATRAPAHQPLSAKAAGAGLAGDGLAAPSTGAKASNGDLASRFAAVRVRPAHRDYKRTGPRPEEWLLIEWPKGEAEPTKYWLSTLPARHAARAPRRASPSCAGASSGTTRSSSRSSASATSKAAAGEASTTTPACASPPTAS